MSSVLLVEDDPALLRSLRRNLTKEGFNVHTAEGTNGALGALETFHVDVLLTDLRLLDGDGLTLIEHCVKRFPHIRPVLMSAYASGRDHQTAIELGAVKVLMKPFSDEQLIDAVRQAEECGTGFRGSVHGISLVDVLQMFHFAQRSMTVHIATGEGAKIHIRDGEIIHAELGDTEGEAALQSILSANSGSVRTSTLERDVPRTIQRSFDSLLLGALATMDEDTREHPVVVTDDDDDFADFKSYVPPPDTAEVLENAASGDAFDELVAAAMTDADAFGTHQKGQAMGKIDDACAQVVDKVDGATACGVVDLDTGMLLGIHNTASYTQTLNEVVAAAAVDLFRGPNVSRIEQMVRKHRGVDEDGGHYFQEMHIVSEHNYHFMKTIKAGKAVIVLVTKKTTNVGMGWAMLKSVIGDVEPHVP